MKNSSIIMDDEGKIIFLKINYKKKKENGFDNFVQIIKLIIKNY